MAFRRWTGERQCRPILGQFNHIRWTRDEYIRNSVKKIREHYFAPLPLEKEALLRRNRSSSKLEKDDSGFNREDAVRESLRLAADSCSDKKETIDFIATCRLEGDLYVLYSRTISN